MIFIFFGISLYSRVDTANPSSPYWQSLVAGLPIRALHGVYERLYRRGDEGCGGWPSVQYCRIVFNHKLARRFNPYT